MRSFVYKTRGILKFVITFLLVFSISTTGIILINSTATPVGTASLSVGSDTAQKGGSVKLPVNLTSNPGVALIAVRLNFDRAALTLTKAEYVKGVLGDPDDDTSDFEKSKNYTDNPYKMIWDDGDNRNPATATGIIGYVTFAVKDTATYGDYEVSLTADACYDVNLDNFALSTTAGKITVGGGTQPPPVHVDSPTVNDISFDFAAEKIVAKNGLTLQFSSTATTSWTTFDSNGVSITDYIGKEILVRCKEGNSYSESISVTVASRSAAPAKLEAQTVSHNSVTLKAIENAKYKIGTGNWQNSGTFSGLSANTKYTFSARFNATVTSFASNAVTADITTLQVPNPDGSPALNDIAFDYANELLKTATGLDLEFSDSQSGATWTSLNANGVSITDKIGKTVYVRQKGKTAVLTLNIPARPAAPRLFEIESTTETSVTVKEISGGEYKIDGGNWTSERTFSGLVKDQEYRFFARYKATATSFASAENSNFFTTNRKVFSGTIKISGTPEYGKSLTVSVSGTPSGVGEIKYQWFRNGEKIPSANADLYFINEADVGNQLHVEVRATSTDYIGYVASEIVIVKKGTPEAVVFPTAKTITYGEKLKDAKWENKGAGDGTFAFKDDESTVPSVGTHKFTVVFAPAKSNIYNNVEREVSVTVKSSGGSSGGGSSGGGSRGGTASYIPTTDVTTTTTPTTPAVPEVPTELNDENKNDLPSVEESESNEDNGTSGNNGDNFGGSYLDEQLKTALKSSNPTVTFDDETGTVISRENLLAIRKSGKTVKFILSDDVYITIAAADISSNPHGVDLDLKVRAVAANVAISENVRTTSKSVVVTPFAHGEFGFTETMHISDELLDRIGADDARVYYVADNDAVSDYGKAAVGNGVSFKISHASQYVVSDTKPSTPNTGNGAGTVAPSGGNSGNGGNSIGGGRSPNPNTGIPNTGVPMNLQFELAISLSLMIACLVCRPKRCLAVVADNFIVAKIREQLNQED